MTSHYTPKVFLSYSHDSDQHKDWVRQLAERLRHDGVDIILDQWDLAPGDDVTSFMEHAFSSCDRVLIICTEQYVKKANTLTGGVGHERMIITAETAQEMKIRKFIPILRNTVKEALPKFLGPRMYLDFRTDDVNQRPYEDLLRALLEQPRHKRPALGKSPFAGTQGTGPTKGEKTPASHSPTITAHSSVASAGSLIDGHDPWCYHWHRSVHEYCGYKLHLILLRFAADSILMKESVITDLRLAGVSNYMIFHLYSRWDILLRVWADDEIAAKLKNRLTENRDLHTDHQPEFLLVQKLTHFPGAGSHPDSEKDIGGILGPASLSRLKEVQDRGLESTDFALLRGSGLILDENVGFDPDRIQVYITIRSLYPLEVARLNRLEAMVAGWTKVHNRSIYVTGNSAIGVVVKAQAENYYDIDEFLRAITWELKPGDVLTETMLVANREVRMGKRVDCIRAERHIIDRELQERIPEIGQESVLPLGERWMLVAKYAEVRERLQCDKDGILVRLIRAKAKGCAEDVGRVLSFFPTLEERLRRGLVQMLVRVYGNGWKDVIDDIKATEGVAVKKVDDLAFGDLCKVYKRIVLDERLISIEPLSDEEFSALMDAAPVNRNEFAHRAPDLRKWDSLFSFCAGFIPIYWRLLEAVEKSV